MSILELDGLIGSHPLGALAAFGLLRVLTRDGARPRLFFAERDDWVARLECEHTSVEDLIAWLSTWIQKRSTDMLTWAAEDVRVRPEEYREVLGRALRASDEDTAAFLAALAADGAVDKSKGLIKPTALYMASGQQSFLESMKAIRAFICGDPVDAFRECLVGPWTYSAPLWGAGWDPATERMHALRFKAPTKEKTSCVAGAVWLAFEAVPFFPTFSTASRDRTVAFVSHDRAKHFRWAIPKVAIGLGTLALLLASREVAFAPKGALRPGVGAIYEATRHEFGQGYAVFRPAHRVQ